MKKSIVFVMALVCAGLLIGRTAWADEDEDEKTEKHEMLAGGKVNGETLEQVKVSLDAGLAAAQPKGKPISAKFEMDNGKLQLSIYTMKGGKFSEIIVDHETDKVTKSEPITGGEDLAAAKAQAAAMAKAKMSLRKAVQKAVKDNKGYVAISVAPSLKDGHPVAEISLGQEEEVKTVSVKLD